MNIHVSDEIRNRYPQYEFIGKPVMFRDGKHYIKALFKVWGVAHFYCFEDDWFWFDKPEFK